MPRDPAPSIATRSHLLFGAGFAFGVACAMVLLALVVASYAGPDVPVDAGVMLVILAGVVLDAAIGVGLYLLAFPENVPQIPIPIGSGSGDD